MEQWVSLINSNPGLLAFSLFMHGTLVASFIGVLVDRLPHQLEWCSNPDPTLKIWSPRSHCPECKTTLRFYELIPIIGWALNAGRCRTCFVRIPLRYPLIELGTGLATAAGYWIFGWSGELAAYILLLWSSVFLSWIDLEETWLPAIATTPLLWIGLLVSPFEADAQMRILGAVIGGGGMLAAFAIASYFKKMDVYSGGDVALMMVGGAWLGAAALFDFVLLTSLFVVAHSMPARLRGEVWVPMGPSLCLSLLAVMILHYHDIGILFRLDTF